MLTQHKIKNFSDEELLHKSKAARSILICTCVLVGILIGAAIFSTIKNGIGFFTFFPIFFVFIIANGQKDSKAISEEIKIRQINRE